MNDELDTALSGVLAEIGSSAAMGDIHFPEGDCDCVTMLEDDDDADMEIHVTLSDAPEGDEWEVREVSVCDIELPLTINDTPVAIPFRIRIIKVG